MAFKLYVLYKICCKDDFSNISADEEVTHICSTEIPYFLKYQNMNLDEKGNSILNLRSHASIAHISLFSNIIKIIYLAIVCFNIF